MVAAYDMCDSIFGFSWKQILHANNHMKVVRLAIHHGGEYAVIAGARDTSLH